MLLCQAQEYQELFHFSCRRLLLPLILTFLSSKIFYTDYFNILLMFLCSHSDSYCYSSITILLMFLYAHFNDLCYRPFLHIIMCCVSLHLFYSNFVQCSRHLVCTYIQVQYRYPPMSLPTYAPRQPEFTTSKFRGGGGVRYTREQKKCHMRKIGTICVDRYLHICILSLFLLTIFLPSINLTDCQIFAVYLHIYTLSLYCLMIFPPSVNLTFHSDVNDCSLLCIHFPYIVNCLTV